jgi:hypothetical protein
MKKHLILGLLFLLAGRSIAQIAVNPNGVNVNTNGTTTVFLTFGRVVDKVPVEAFWCGELISAAPDIGQKPAPGTIFGQLPIRYDLSKLNPDGSFTDIMSIPMSVTKRAYQAAKGGATSSFFYVRRFSSTIGGPDEYVAVTCRLAGGGARVPFALMDVTITDGKEELVSFVKLNQRGPEIKAEIYYNGTGQLKGRWEVVLPGEEPPTNRDLLTEGTLPVEERGLQRRYTEVSRFNVFLPPTGKFILPGPDAKKIPTNINGLHMLLLRIEVSDDKEGESNLSSIDAGPGVVHSGAVAGFPLPPFRYYVGNSEKDWVKTVSNGLQLLLPGADASHSTEKPIDFSWDESSGALAYKLVVKDAADVVILSAVLQAGAATYRAPDWLKDRTQSALSWQVHALNHAGDILQTSESRVLNLLQPEIE